MERRKKQQLVILLLGVGILTVFFVPSRLSEWQKFKIKKQASEKRELVESTIPDSTTLPDLYQTGVSLFDNNKSKNANEQVTAALAIDSIASQLNDEKLVSRLQAKSEELIAYALQSDSNHVDALLNQALIDIYRYDKIMVGVPKLLKVVKLDPNNESAIFQLGIFAIKSGQIDKAIERFEKLVSLQPQNKEYHKNLALLYNQIGDAQKARKHAALAQ